LSPMHLAYSAGLCMLFCGNEGLDGERQAIRHAMIVENLQQLYTDVYNDWVLENEQAARKTAVALYCMHGFVNPFLAAQTGFSEADLELFLEALKNGLELGRSRAVSIWASVYWQTLLGRSHFTSNRVFRYTSALNHVSEQNSCRWCPAASPC
jgi:CRISPR-associated protein Cas7